MGGSAVAVRTGSRGLLYQNWNVGQKLKVQFVTMVVPVGSTW